MSVAGHDWSLCTTHPTQKLALLVTTFRLGIHDDVRDLELHVVVFLGHDGMK